MQQLIAIAQVLAFLGTAALLVLLLVTSLVSLGLGRGTWARRALMAGGTVSAGYVLMLLGVGLVSADHMLAPDHAKVFCEFDCHVQYLVQGSHTTRDSSSASGVMRSVTVSIEEVFDAASISSRRGNGLLYPGSRRFRLVDSRGMSHAPVLVTAIGSASLFAPMVPGERHRARLTFSLPGNVTARALAVESDDAISPLLIGHERSPFHGRELLPVSDGAVAAR